MSNNLPAMTIKLLSVRRTGKGLEPGHAEVKIHLTGCDGRIPWSGTLKVQVPQSLIGQPLKEGTQTLAWKVFETVLQSALVLEQSGQRPQVV
ncbi:hypothetical protein A0U92_03520 [Acetobacter aceti]|uniref:Uncharacterized protein n=1 Tax=Acetobacter aceti TaxID=435 RepID=A0A1U9KDW5_ACEAC|nr:hypothetical protein A0U92_03520 [Acetobacter aceti]